MGIDLGRFKSKRDDEWDDWLSDDPVPATFRERIGLSNRNHQAPTNPVVHRPGQAPARRPAAGLSSQRSFQPVPKPDVTDKNTDNHAVSINISIPKFKKPDLRKKFSSLPPLPKNLTYKRLGIGSGALAIVLVIGVIAVSTRSDNKNTPGTTNVLSSSDQKASFEYSLPTGAGSDVKPDEVRYDAQKKVVNFTDSIGGVDITISQQPLPDDFKNDTAEKVKKLAEGFSATKTVTTANPTAYIGTSVKGPQTVIFSKKDLLVFIQSTKQIDDHDWAEYITNLK